MQAKYSTDEIYVVFDGYINKLSTKDQAPENGSSFGNVAVNIRKLNEEMPVH